MNHQETYFFKSPGLHSGWPYFILVTAAFLTAVAQFT
jgi:hypothetical protein